MYSIHSYNDERFGMYARGEFRMARDNEALKFWIITGVYLLNIINFFVTLYLQYTTNPFPKIYNPITWAQISTAALPALILFQIIVLIAYIAAIRILFMGTKYSFKANEKEFALMKSDKPEQMVVIPYSDVLTIRYKFRKFLFFERGYTITIVMRGGKVYEYFTVFPRGDGDRSFYNTPFNIIAEETGVHKRDTYRV